MTYCYLNFAAKFHQILQHITVVRWPLRSSSTIVSDKSGLFGKSKYIRRTNLKQDSWYNAIIVICKILRFPFYHHYHTNQREFHTSSDKPPPKTYRYPDQFHCVYYVGHYIYSPKVAGNSCRSPPRFRILNHS